MSLIDKRYGDGVLAPAAFVLLGVIAAVVAWKKGRSFPIWLLLGLLLGPIAFIAALVVRRV